MITKMKDFQSQLSENNITQMIDCIEEAIKENATGRFYPWVSAIIDGEFPDSDRNEVARRYLDEGGWYAAFHQTSSENGERYGLTGFELFTPESYEKWRKAHGEDYKNKGYLFFREKN